MMRRVQVSVGRIVFLALFCMSLGALAIGFVSVYGAQTFRREFERLVDEDLPQATVATRLNAEILGLTSLVGLLVSADTEIAAATTLIQLQDQLNAIERQSRDLSGFSLRPGEYTDIETALAQLSGNLDSLVALNTLRLRSEAGMIALSDRASRAPASTDARLAFLLWRQELDAANLTRELHGLGQRLDALLAPDPTRPLAAIGHEMLAMRRTLLETETVLRGRLKNHIQLSYRLADSTRFMSSRLISGANQRGDAILSLVRTNMYLILISFLVFATISAFIYTFLDKQVVGRVQKLTQRIRSYEGRGREPDPVGRNEITLIEAAFSNLTATIAEREGRLVALNRLASDARLEAEEANRSKSELLAAASHDLRQPVHAMGLLIGGIDRNALDAASCETLDQLARLTQETMQLFNSILDLSKLQAGTFTAAQEPIRLAELFGRIQAAFGKRAELAGATLDITLPSSGLCVLGDPQALYRILGNLIANAIQYAGGGQIRLHCDTGEESCTITVEDDGPGFVLDGGKPDMSGPRPSRAGYGLGLSICFALAQAMQSRMTIDRPEAGGVRFSLPLPLAETIEGQPSALPGPPVGTTALDGVSIVLLEDDPEVRAATLQSLSRLKCDVTDCASQEDARQLISQRAEPFLLITDLDLGRGHQVCSLVDEALETAAGLAGVIVTTASPAAVPEAWHRTGKVAVLEKPFSGSRLVRLVRFLAKQNNTASDT